MAEPISFEQFLAENKENIKADAHQGKKIMKPADNLKKRIVKNPIKEIPLLKQNSAAAVLKPRNAKSKICVAVRKR